MSNRKTLELNIVKQLEDTALDDGIIQSGFLFTDKHGNSYTYHAEVTYMLDKPVWVNSMFASRCQWHLKDNPDEPIFVTAQISDANELINPRMKKEF